MIAGDGPERGELGLSLVEVLIAAGLVAMTMAGGQRIVAAAAEARLGAEHLLGALEQAEARVELLRVVPEGEGADDDLVASAWRAAPCRTSRPWRRTAVEVVGQDAAVAGLLFGTGPTGGTGSQVIALRDGDGSGMAEAVVELVATDGSVTSATSDGDGCVILPAEVEGRLELSGSSPGGRYVLLSGGPQVVEVVVMAEGWIRIDVVSDGSWPDRVSGGELSWWLPDAPDPSAVGPSVGRPSAAGSHRVSVGWCADHRAGGTGAVAHVPAGGEVAVTVTLGAIAIEADLAGAGVRVILTRGRPCPGSGERPRLEWDHGEGTGTLLAAVSDGVWELRVLDADDRLIAGPAEVLVAGGTVTRWP